MTPFDPVSPKADFPQIEEEILQFWKENDSFRKSIELRKDAEPFIFYDGPPFATGLPHYGHILAGTIKDVVPRYQTMLGKKVPRRFGWDCHGVPVEHEMEKQLGFKNRDDIENYGIQNFCESCRGIVLKYTGEWEKTVDRMGRWVDFEDSYRTMDPEYMESILGVFKALWDKGYIYEGKKVIAYSPKLASPLSNFEANLNYKDIDDPAVTVKFELLDPLFDNAKGSLESPPDNGDFNPRLKSGVKILSWTTTPWTLPSNLGLCVSPKIEYALVEFPLTPELTRGLTETSETTTHYIVAKKLVKKIFGNKILNTAKDTYEVNPGHHFITFNTEDGAEIFDTDEKRSQCAEVFREIIQEEGYRVFDLAVMPDHIHLTLEVVEGQVSLQKMVQKIKGASSHKIKERLSSIEAHSLSVNPRVNSGVNATDQSNQKLQKERQDSKGQLYTPLWRKGYDKKFIYDEAEYQKISEYIRQNPVKKGLPEQKYNWLAKTDDPYIEYSVKIIDTFPGTDLIGKKYKPLFPFFKNHENAFHIFGDDFVSDSDGTGIVHLAPTGEDDARILTKEKVELLYPFTESCYFDFDAAPLTHELTRGLTEQETQLVESLQGLYFRKDPTVEGSDRENANKWVLQQLRESGQLFKEESIKHSYPHCWRTDCALMYRGIHTFFVDVQRIKTELIAKNKDIHWVPEHIREGRFGKMLENAPDWAISRNRYWGAPIPVWRCECGHREVAGSVKEIAEKATSLTHELTRGLKKGKLFVVRHGEAEHNVKNIISSDLNDSVPLTEKGVCQASDFGKSLKEMRQSHIDIVITSPLLRAQQTAENILKGVGETDIEIITDERLREIDAGKLNNRPIAEWREQFPNLETRFHENPHEGESTAMVMERTSDFLRDIQEKYPKKNILIVTHGGVVHCIQHYFLSTPHAELYENPPQNCHLYEFSFSARPENDEKEIDLHRPYIDRVKFDCEKCGGEMNRVDEVLDCWFESGSMPYASNGINPAKNSPLDKGDLIPMGKKLIKNTLLEELQNIGEIIETITPENYEEYKRKFHRVGTLPQDIQKKLQLRNGKVYMDGYVYAKIRDWAGEKTGHTEIEKSDFYFLPALISQPYAIYESKSHEYRYLLCEREKDTFVVVLDADSKYTNILSFFYVKGNRYKKLDCLWKNDEHEKRDQEGRAVVPSCTLSSLRKEMSSLAARFSSCQVSQYRDAINFFEKNQLIFSERSISQEKIDNFPLNISNSDFPFPADFIAEGLDQTRGWFYTLHVLGNALFDSPATKNILVNGIVLAEDGQKMSKSKKNYPDPQIIFDKFGADAMRFYLMNSPVVRAEDFRFAEKGVEEVLRKILLPLWNSYSFLVTYANIDDWKPVGTSHEDVRACHWQAPTNKLDKWILAELGQLVKKFREKMDVYELDGACKEIPEFLDKLTNFYIRRSRRRFWKSEVDTDKSDAFETLFTVIKTLAQVLAPVTPYLPEKIWQNFRKVIPNAPESIHHTDFPIAEEFADDPSLRAEISALRAIISSVLAIRSKKKIRVRQPLSVLKIALPPAISKEMIEANRDVILEEINVKEIHFVENTSELAEVVAKPNARLLGPRFGKEVQFIIKEAKAGNFTENEDGTITIADKWTVSTDEVEVGFLGKEGLDVESAEGIVVALDTEITEELKNEGIAREIIRHIQDMRKEADYQIADRITVALSGVENVVSEYGEMIAEEVLATEIKASLDSADIEKEVDIEGMMVKVGVKR